MRAIVFDDQARICGMAQREFEQKFPRPGWVEHDPEEIWTNQLDVMRSAVERAGIESGEIAGIGITNQRETVLLWDRATGEPLHHAIVWQDRRTSEECDSMRAQGHEELLTRRTGLLFDPYFSGNETALAPRQRARRPSPAERGELAAGTIETWLIWKLTGGRLHVSDVSNASRTLLYDIHENDWNDELLALFDIPRTVLPGIVPCSQLLGETEADLLGTPVPVAGMIGDQQSALFGQLCVEPGMSKTTFGTGCFTLMNTGGDVVHSPNRLLGTVAWRIGDEPVQYALEGSVFMAGASIQWLRDGLGIIDSAPEVNELAASVLIPAASRWFPPSPVSAHPTGTPRRGVRSSD